MKYNKVKKPFLNLNQYLHLLQNLYKNNKSTRIQIKTAQNPKFQHILGSNTYKN